MCVCVCARVRVRAYVRVFVPPAAQSLLLGAQGACDSALLPLSSLSLPGEHILSLPECKALWNMN
jgi:hypothetical protein